MFPLYVLLSFLIQFSKKWPFFQKKVLEKFETQKGKNIRIQGRNSVLPAAKITPNAQTAY
jgi:hypothetical protein